MCDVCVCDEGDETTNMSACPMDPNLVTLLGFCDHKD